MFPFAAKYGALGAAIVIVGTVLTFMLDVELPPWISIGIMLGVLIWGQLAYRKSTELGISYGETFGLGVLIILVLSVLSSIYTAIHWGLIDPEMGARILAQGEEALRQQGMSGAQLDAAMDVQKMMMGPIVTPVIGLITSMLMGTVMALITSIFTRKAAD